MNTNYYAYGDYGWQSECLLAEFNSAQEGRNWLDNYVRFGDMGGYAVIELAYFADNGEYVTLETIESGDYN